MVAVAALSCAVVHGVVGVMATLVAVDIPPATGRVGVFGGGFYLSPFDEISTSTSSFGVC